MTSLGSEVRSAIQELLDAGFDVRLIGATALAATLEGGITRQTIDVDLITMVPDWARFPAVLSTLADVGWAQDRSVEHRFRHIESGQMLDVVP